MNTNHTKETGDCLVLSGSFTITGGIDFSTYAPGSTSTLGIVGSQWESRVPVTLSSGQLYSSNAIDGVTWANLAITHDGSTAIDCDNQNQLINCDIDLNGYTSLALNMDSASRVLFCRIHGGSSSATADLLSLSGGSAVIGCHIDMNGATRDLGVSGSDNMFIGNIVIGSGLQAVSRNNVTAFNTIIQTTANNGTGIGIDTTSAQVTTCFGNYIEGFLEGISQSNTTVGGPLLMNNRFYDCTTNIVDDGGGIPVGDDNSSLSSALYTDSQNDDWTIANTDADTKYTDPAIGMTRRFGAVEEADDSGGGIASLIGQGGGLIGRGQ
jgi:hypothetical protein